MKPVPQVSRVARPFYFALGIVCCGLGYIGYVTPGLPGTVFFIIALWAFKRSSPKLEDWILNRSVVGPILRDWERDRSMRPRTKVVAILFVWVSILSSCALIWSRGRSPWLPPLLLVIALSLTVYIATRKTTQL